MGLSTSNILYKYLDINGAIMMLHYSNLMYANATTFNDPFDCHPSLINFSNVPKGARGGWPAKVIEDIESNRHENYRNDLWICCLSKLYNSILMWSYYNNHTGVCIGLNMDKVAKYINVNYGMMVSSIGREVKYRDIVNKPDCYRDIEDLFSYQIFTKAKAWEHEQEVRLYIFKPSPMFMALLPFQHDKNEFDGKEIRTFVKLGAECFESIYFGVRINEKEKEKITQLAKTLNPGIKIYQMEIDTKSFNLVDRQEMNYKLSDYIDLFSNLHTNKQQGKSAPHKAIMLLSVIELISSQHITTNEIVYTERLEECFMKTWKRFVKEASIFKPKAGTPFWQLNYEPFWQLIPYEGGYETIVKLQKGNSYSSGTIRKYIKYAVIDMELFLLLQDSSNRETLKQVLVNSLDFDSNANK